MKILLVGNYLPDRQESMQRFANVMLEELTHSGHEVKLIRPIEKLLKFPWPKKLEKWIGYVDKFLLFPFTLRSAVAWADIVHICDHSNSMYVKHVKSKPHLITCHDLLAVRSARGEFPENPVGFTGRLLQSWIGLGLKSAQFIVCDSYATLNDCKQTLGISAEYLDIVYLGLNYPYRPMDVEDSYELLCRFGIINNQHYFMNIGNNSWYKNRLSVLKIFALLVNYHKIDLSMIFAGKKLTPEMDAFIVNAGISSRIRQLGLVSNEELCALYSRAEGLIFPSFEEGFGWPVLEAQASACPVFASNRAPMTEIGGDAAVYIDPFFPERSARIISEHLSSLDSMRERGLINSAKFSNVAMRDGYLKIYSRLVHNV